jgi:aminoglycoside phosphotransferase family enzyme
LTANALILVDTNANSSTPVSLAEKVAFLGSADAHVKMGGPVICRETHMSWVFLAGEEVYKLKKPIRLSYLDFSSLERRRAACEAELMLNRRLAPDVYLSVTPLTRSRGRLAIGGPGEIVDWLVVMRRLDETGTLEHALLTKTLMDRQLDPLVATLAEFYRHAGRVAISPDSLVADWHFSLSENRQALLDRRAGLSIRLVLGLDRIQRRFLGERSDRIRARARHRRIVDGHGDLRPEHIWLGPPVRIIDCLEFNPRLRAVDPLDEIAFLTVECERLGGARYGDYIRQRIANLLPGGFEDDLFTFYRCYRATLRARLAIAHLFEPKVRTPDKWPRLALRYLELASKEGDRLHRILSQS